MLLTQLDSNEDLQETIVLLNPNYGIAGLPLGPIFWEFGMMNEIRNKK